MMSVTRSIIWSWNSCGMTQSTVLKVPTLEYLPYCFFNLISPLMSILIAAIGYTLPLLPRLSRYVNDGRFCIDNNLVENAIRPLALGRKNFLFCGNHDAAVRAAIVYSLVDSCKALDVDPREWMEDVLLRIPGNENNREALRELLPDRWAKQTN